MISFLGLNISSIWALQSIRRGTWSLWRCGVDWFSNEVVSPPCRAAVISNPIRVCDVCVFHATAYVEMKLFAVLWFLVWLFSCLKCSMLTSLMRAQFTVILQARTIVLENIIGSCFWPLQTSAVSAHSVSDNDNSCVFILWKILEV